ncbi:hypothetical protein C8T65DRAFT_662127, partial [Cerioporus squamosus]
MGLRSLLCLLSTGSQRVRLDCPSLRIRCAQPAPRSRRPRIAKSTRATVGLLHVCLDTRGQRELWTTVSNGKTSECESAHSKL